MAKALGVWLLSIAFFCCTNLSLARQVPKECSKGPVYWCENLKQGADCGAVGHCIGTVWETQKYNVKSNAVSDKFVKLFKQLKDVKDLINEDYLMNRVASECHDVQIPGVSSICKNNINSLEQYLYHVLKSETSPEAMCQIIGMCNNDKLDNILAVQHNQKKAPEPKKSTSHKVHLVGAAHCTWGPAYWCSNFSTSHECGANKHCVQAVWSKQKYPEDSDTVCKMCSEMATMVRRELQSNKTQAELSELVDGFCLLMRRVGMEQQCEELVGKYVPELLETLATEMNAQEVCSAAGLCNNADIDKLLVEHEKKEAAKPKEHKKLLGDIRCTEGPAYWCSNFSTGHQCSATKFCARSVWPKLEVPEDHDSICKICTDMVAQARDQLESNETQEELKEVFEGSCKLIPIKLITKECIKLADDFVPELVETLASQMNPQQVCSVAGLCNSARIDTMLEGYNTQLARVQDCNNCQQTAVVARRQFDQTTYEDFLVKLLQVCHKMDSFSDSCSMLVFKYYEKILAAVRKDLTPTSVCHLSGQCTRRFHTHDLYTFPTFEPKVTDDVPCEFCEQVVKHLRDVLVANTTEVEFYKVLKGLCKQTGEFKDECLSLAEQYYPLIYKYLVEDLEADKICALMGLCGPAVAGGGPVAPLLPSDLVIKHSDKLIGADEANSYKVGRVQLSRQQSTVRVMTDAPVAAYVPYVLTLPQSKAACSFCQYFLHYLQVELSDSKTEDAIKDAVDKACDRLPESVEGECKSFVSQYGPSVIALLVQEIDPASVCPALNLCPQVTEVRRVAINAEKSNCPLCLFAVEQLETMLVKNRTEENIRHALDNLCNHLSSKLKTQCMDFVDEYTNQLVQMLVANMNAQEICVFLKLCKDNVADPLKITNPAIDKYHQKPHLMGDRNNFRKKSLLPAHMLVQNTDIETNEIPDNTVNGRVVEPQAPPKTVCIVCEFVLKEIDDQIKDKHNDDEIKRVVHGVCKHMPKSVRSSCDDFVEKYADMVISLLAQELDPSEVCEKLKLCPPSMRMQKLDLAREEILDCAVCQTVVMAVKKVLSNDKVDRDIVHIVEKSCALLPAKYSTRCHTMLEIYGDSIIHLIEEFGTKGVCQKIGLCAAGGAAVRMFSENN